MSPKFVLSYRGKDVGRFASEEAAQAIIDKALRALRRIGRLKGDPPNYGYAITPKAQP